jgi:hypothetical protein
MSGSKHHAGPIRNNWDVPHSPGVPDEIVYYRIWEKDHVGGSYTSPAPDFRGSKEEAEATIARIERDVPSLRGQLVVEMETGHEKAG